MKVELISHTSDAAALCGQAAAVCTDSRNYGSALNHAVGSGYTSVLEHAVFTFKVEGLSRATLAQLTRHRLASFDVQSQRYVRLDDPELVIPESIKASPFAAEAESTVRYVMNLYQRMVEAGDPLRGCPLHHAPGSSHCAHHDDEREGAASLFLAAHLQPRAVGDPGDGRQDAVHL